MYCKTTMRPRSSSLASESGTRGPSTCPDLTTCRSLRICGATSSRAANFRRLGGLSIFQTYAHRCS